MNKNVLCCIFNYNKDENAVRWANLLNKSFPTVIMDTYVKDNASVSDCLSRYKGNILYFHNIFLGGLTIEAFKMCIGGCFDFLVIINSDVEIDDKNLCHLKNRLDSLPKNIGVYEVSATVGSCVMGVEGQIEYTKKYFEISSDEFKDGGFGEGWLYGINCNVIKKVFPFLSYDKNKYGWGIGAALIGVSESIGLRNVIDSNVFVFHPKGTGYDSTCAKYEWQDFDLLSEEMGFEYTFFTVGYCSPVPNPEYTQYLKYYFSSSAYIVEKVCDIKNVTELKKAYNEIIENSFTNTVILVKDGTFFILNGKETYSNSRFFHKQFLKNKDVGIIGCAIKYFNKNDIIERKEEPNFSFVENDVKYESGNLPLYSDGMVKDAIVDGHVLAVRKDRIKKMFNEESFLPYDAEFCIDNYLAGVGVGVTKAAFLAYEKESSVPDEENEICKKYQKYLPIYL